MRESLRSVAFRADSTGRRKIPFPEEQMTAGRRISDRSTRRTLSWQDGHRSGSVRIHAASDGAGPQVIPVRYPRSKRAFPACRDQAVAKFGWTAFHISCAIGGFPDGRSLTVPEREEIGLQPFAFDLTRENLPRAIGATASFDPPDRMKRKGLFDCAVGAVIRAIAQDVATDRA